MQRPSEKHLKQREQTFTTMLTVPPVQSLDARTPHSPNPAPSSTTRFPANHRLHKMRGEATTRRDSGMP